MQFLLGVFFAILSMIGLGGGDFLAGLSARKIGDKLSLFFIFLTQTLISITYWLIFKHTLNPSLLLTSTILFAGILQGFGLLLFYKAMSQEKISLVSPIFAVYSLLTVLFGIFILKDPLTVTKGLAIVIILLGTLLASTDFSFKTTEISFIKNKGIQIAILGSLSFAIAFLLMTLVFKYGEFYFYNSLYSLSTFLTAFVLLGTSIVTEIRKQSRKTSIPVLVGITYASANIFFALALQHVPSSLVAAITSAFPAITVLSGFVFLKEKLVNSQKLGTLLIILGLVLVSL